jgi:hypothetical protein
MQMTSIGPSVTQNTGITMKPTEPQNKMSEAQQTDHTDTKINANVKGTALLNDINGALKNGGDEFTLFIGDKSATVSRKDLEGIRDTMEGKNVTFDKSKFQNPVFADIRVESGQVVTEVALDKVATPPTPITFTGTGESVNLGRVNVTTMPREQVVSDGHYNDGDKNLGSGSRVKNNDALTKYSNFDHKDNLIMTQFSQSSALGEINGALAKDKGEVYLEVLTGGTGKDDVTTIKFDMANPADRAKLQALSKEIAKDPNYKGLMLEQGGVINQADGSKTATLPSAGGTYNYDNAKLVIMHRD